MRPAQQGQGLAQRGQQLGATAPVETGQVLHGAVAVPVAGLDQPGRQALRAADVVVEREHREPVGGGECVNDARGSATGGHYLPAGHAAGAIQHQHYVAGAGRASRGARQYGELIGTFLTLGVGHQHQ